MSLDHILAQQRDRLQVQLQESERLRQDAFQACEAMRQSLAAVTLERDEWKAAVEYQQQQAMQLRQHVEALESSVEQGQGVNKTLAGQLADKQRQSKVLMKERDDRTAQLQSAIQQVSELQAQLDAAAVTPTQQPDGTAERLETVRRIVGEIRGWYACVEYLDEIKWAEAWEQVGALLGRLQREAD